ncbi:MULTISPECIES: hypothetical protein [unclassified Methylococcus]|uniref:hypothetical protein n=1 Tax=unclassified Methylococcus TaxID=2618889 RepID=UPI003D7F039F
MSATTDVIGAMRNSGFVLELHGDRLKVRVPPGCPTFYKDLLRSRKSEFIAALKEQQEEATQPSDLTDTERGTLIAMGLRWSYSPEDWDRLWSDCQDPAKRQAWLDTARLEQPPMPEQEDAESTITVRVEGSFGTGRMQFDMRVPAHRWDEAAFSGQIAAMPGAQFWRLDTPKCCSDCLHAQPTQHAALVRCDQRDDPPSCGMWWTDDMKVCREWAPISRTDTRGQTAITK